MFRREKFEYWPVKTPEDFKREFARTKRVRRWYSAWETSRYYSPRLEELLASLDGMETVPETKIELLAAFFKSDSVILNKCDDSNGEMSIVYLNAADKFAKAAASCKDKKKIARLVMKLYLSDEYSMCEYLIEKAGVFLSKQQLSELAEDFWTTAGKAADNMKSHCYYAIESLAEQMKAPELYEKAARASHGGELSGWSYEKVAEVYLESGNAERALELVKSAEPAAEHQLPEHDELLFKIYSALDDRGKMTETARRVFLRSRSKDAFDRLVNLVGREKMPLLLDEEVKKILLSPKINYSDLSFLIEEEKIDEAEKYILGHAIELDGSFYNSLLDYAKTMESNKRWLASSMIYRALLEDVLARANTRYYPFGVRYLLHLDSIAGNVPDWKAFMPHHDYIVEIMETHKRKVSFWNKYAKRETRYTRRGW